MTLGREVVKKGLRKLGLLEHAKAVRDLIRRTPARLPQPVIVPSVTPEPLVVPDATLESVVVPDATLESVVVPDATLDPSFLAGPQAPCPVCSAQSTHFRTVDGFDFFSCSGCGVIHLDPEVLAEIDQGRPIVDYQNDYWEMETQAALERARGMAIARLAEAIYLARRPVELAIDIGTGTGAILDEIIKILPNMGERVYGVEKFPPQKHTASKNYVVGDLKSVGPLKFDAGLCMEVVEHLTPMMLRELLSDLAERSNPDACYVFNTGLARFARDEDPGYVDPLRRGHIMFWTIEAVNTLAAPYGLTASAMPGRNWSFLLEKRVGAATPVADRLYTPLPENKLFLADGNGGWGLAGITAFEALRAYYFSTRPA